MSDQIPPMGKLGKRKAVDRKVLIKSPQKTTKKVDEDPAKDPALDQINQDISEKSIEGIDPFLLRIDKLDKLDLEEVEESPYEREESPDPGELINEKKVEEKKFQIKDDYEDEEEKKKEEEEEETNEKNQDENNEKDEEEDEEEEQEEEGEQEEDGEVEQEEPRIPETIPHPIYAKIEEV